MSGSISEGGMCPKGAHPLPKTKFSRIKKLNIKSNLRLDLESSLQTDFFFLFALPVLHFWLHRRVEINNKHSYNLVC